MAILISVNHIRKAYGTRALFDDLTLVVESGDRIGLIGPNGAGKSTLLKILAGSVSPDGGSLSFQRGLRVGYLEQLPALDPKATVLSTVLEGTPDREDSESIATAHECIAKVGLDTLEVSPESLVGDLSGGWKKRVALAREMARRPDVLLLDEPTNHLDVESILWLERVMARAPFATVTITHDRLFLQRVSNRILELDRRNPGGLLDIRGDYTAYLEVKQDLMSAQEQKEVSLRNTLRRETEWLRRGAKARTTKQQARIQRAEALGDEVNELSYRNQNKTARLDFQTTDNKGPKRLIEATGVSKSYGGRKLFSDVDLFLGPGSRVGLLGMNGAGKSTLIRMLLGQEEPDSGKIYRSDKVEVAYFEQNRDTLDPNITVWKTLAPDGEHVNYRGKFVHIRGYLGRFLFPPEQLEMAVGKLSGGEQSRLLIARLMLIQANVLVLDEPTNDLDMATLDVLQECLAEFAGAILLVTHDRYFLDQVASEILAFHDGKIVSFAGLEQWETWHENLEAAPSAAKVARVEASTKKRKLGFKEQREYDTMEATIHKAEAVLLKLQEESQSSEIASNASRLMELYNGIAQAQAEVERLYSRWSELEKLKENL